MVTFRGVLLEHHCGAAKGEPTPLNFSFDNPLMPDLEAETIAVELEGAFDVRYREKGNHLPDVVIGANFGAHEQYGKAHMVVERLGRYEGPV